MAGYAYGSKALRSGSRRSGFKVVLYAALAVVAAPFLLTALYLVLPPPSTLMLARYAAARPVVRVWTPLDRIAPALPRAVIASEDAGFCRHHGVDWGAIREVMRRSGDQGPDRGASTIAMQVAKNLFLWPGAPYLRKPIEIVLALWIDLVWPKRRVMEVYLNIAEWGPDGVFGAEAGARRAFGRSAAGLTPPQAALMAAALPNPILRDTRRPNARMRGHAATIGSRARAGAALAACLN